MLFFHDFLRILVQKIHTLRDGIREREISRGEIYDVLIAENGQKRRTKRLYFCQVDIFCMLQKSGRFAY